VKCKHCFIIKDVNIAHLISKANDEETKTNFLVAFYDERAHSIFSVYSKLHDFEYSFSNIWDKENTL